MFPIMISPYHSEETVVNKGICDYLVSEPVALYIFSPFDLNTI